MKRTRYVVLMGMATIAYLFSCGKDEPFVVLERGEVMRC